MRSKYLHSFELCKNSGSFIQMSVIYSHCSVLSMPQPSVNIMVCFYNCSNLGTIERLVFLNATML